MDDRTPWRVGTLEVPAAGLREAVLRVAYMRMDQVQRLAKSDWPAGVQNVARWRLLHPERFAELCDLLGIPAEVRSGPRAPREAA